jgi:hypothetical protein
MGNLQIIESLKDQLNDKDHTILEMTTIIEQGSKLGASQTYF